MHYSKNIHGRINRRANMVNHAKCFGQLVEYQRRGHLFKFSFNNDEEPIFEELRTHYRHSRNSKILYN